MRTTSLKPSIASLSLAIAVLGVVIALPGQPNAAAQQATQAQTQGRGGGAGGRGGRGGGAGRGFTGGGAAAYSVYKGRIDPHWFKNNTAFWYRNELKGNASEFILVDAQAGKRVPAFDHEKLAAALSKAADQAVTADHLPFDTIEFVLAGNEISAVRFSAFGGNYSCDLTSYKLTKDQGPPVNAQIVRPFIPPTVLASLRPTSSDDSPRTIDSDFDFEAPSAQAATPLIDLRNRGPEFPNLSSILPLTINPAADDPGAYFSQSLTSDSPLAPPQQTQPDQAGRGAGGADATTGGGGRGAGGRGGRGAGRGGGGGGGRGFGRGGPDVPQASPDGKWTASIANYNIVLRGSDGTEAPITTDGVADNYYTRLSWTQDSASLIAWRRQPGNPLDIYHINVAPRGPNGENLLGGAGRAIAITAPYALPGDKYDNYELNLFDIAAKKQIKPDVGIIDATAAGSNPNIPQLRWKKDNIHFTYEKYDRGHQRVRLIEVNAHTGEVRNLVDDVADGKIQKFIWSANRDGIPSIPMFTYFPNNENEVIYSSEMDGWRHLYLSDASSSTPTLKQIDKGNWILRGIDYIDYQARQIWFSCGGVYPDQDHMLLHYGHVNFDGSDQVIMTAGNGNHSITYSPDYKYIIDTYGNVDSPPVTELRRVSDGKLVTTLEKAEVDGNWRHPVAFGIKTPDNIDVWGIISFPNNYDPNQKYPVVENIYAGPQGSNGTMTPKTFGTAPQIANLLNLGFITVKLEAPGSFGGSKAYHDFAWHNLHDAGWDYRIAWYKAAAEKYPAMDLTRMGIFGTSAGGQNAAAAVLFHPEFYKVAVANSGCHDNRMDKSTWNEQWMGYPLGPWYGENSNIDNAYRLQGHLQLVVGDQDTNVPPESTYRFVDALVQAGKDFELVDVPGANHGAASPITGRKLNDFFIRYLEGTEPPNHNLEPPPARGGRGGRGAAGGGRGGRGGAGGGAGGGAQTTDGARGGGGN